MGAWAKVHYGCENIGRTGIMLAGTGTPEMEKRILNDFDKLLFSKDNVYHTYLAKKGTRTYPVVFNILGASATVDCLSVLHEGGCRNIIFIGYAYGGFRNLEIGNIVIPTKAYHFEGIFHPLKMDKEYSYPDKYLKAALEGVLKKENIPFLEGINISVPAVTLQPKHRNKDYERIKPLTLEMETAALFSRANHIGIRSACVLIISDNKESSLKDDKKRELRRECKRKIASAIIRNIGEFNLKPLKHADKFNIDNYLAEIIETDDASPNVYRK